MKNKKLDFIMDYGEDYLTDWEMEFIDNISIAVSEGKKLTWKQQKCLNKIFVKIESRVG